MSERPYCRVYWSIRSDPKFATVYHDDASLATWLRLLIAADAMWPEPADIPAKTRVKTYRSLVECGLIDDLGHGLYRIHGLDAERSARSDKARASVAHRRDRSGYDRTTTVERPYIDRITSRAEPSQDRAEPSVRAVHDDDPAWLAAWFQMGRRTPPSKAQQKVIDNYLATFDATGPERLARLFLENYTDPIGAAIADLDAFRKERAAEARKAEAVAAKPKRTVPLDDFGRALEERYARLGIRPVTPEEVA